MKLSKADPTGKERPITLSNIGRLLHKNGFTISEHNLYEFFSPIGIISKNYIVLNIFELLDRYMGRTFLKNIQLRWYVLAYKNHMRQK